MHDVLIQVVDEAPGRGVTGDVQLADLAGLEAQGGQLLRKAGTPLFWGNEAAKLAAALMLETAQANAERVVALAGALVEKDHPEIPEDGADDDRHPLS